VPVKKISLVLWLYDPYRCPDIIWVMEAWAGHLARISSRRVAYGVSVGELEGQRRLGRGKLGWDGIMYWEEMGVILDWFSLAQDRDRWRAVSAVMNRLFP